jgi:hypothetical protein
VHCPERCGLCRRTFANPASSHSVSARFVVSFAIELLDVDAFKQNLADSLGISAAQIKIELSIGIFDYVQQAAVVDATLATVSGTQQAAVALASSVSQAFPDASSASATLGVPVQSSPVVAAVSSSPSTPPFPIPPPSTDDDGGGVSVIATIIGVSVAALIIAVLVFTFMNQYGELYRQYMGQIEPKQYAPLVVYASSPIVHTDESSKKRAV